MGAIASSIPIWVANHAVRVRVPAHPPFELQRMSLKIAGLKSRKRLGSACGKVTRDTTIRCREDEIGVQECRNSCTFVWWSGETGIRSFGSAGVMTRHNLSGNENCVLVRIQPPPPVNTYKTVRWKDLS